MNPDYTPFEKLLVDLVRADIRFMTVGGVACSLSGFVRTTEDVDILVSLNGDNIHRLLQTLIGFGQGAARELTPDDFTDEEGAVRVVEEFPLDLFVRMGGMHYEDLLPYVRQAEWDGVQIPFLGPEGLILLKKDSLREKDQIDVLALRRLAKEKP
jgi:hypothetical protein